MSLPGMLIGFVALSFASVLLVAVRTANGQEYMTDDLDDISVIGRDPRLLYSQANIPVYRRSDVSRRFSGSAPVTPGGQRWFSRLSDGSRSSHSSFLPERSSPSQGLHWMRIPTQHVPSADSLSSESESRTWRRPTSGRSHLPLWALLSPRRVRGLRGQYDMDYN